MADFRAALEHVLEIFRVSSLFPEQEQSLKALCGGQKCICKPSDWVWKIFDLLRDSLNRRRYIFFFRPHSSSKIIITNLSFENNDERPGRTFEGY